MLIFSRKTTSARDVFEDGNRTNASSRLAAGQRLRDLPQIGREDAPAHPAPQAGFPVGQTPVQPEPTAPDADAPLDARSEPEAPATPGGPFVL